MLLYSRIVTLTGSPRQIMPWATEITAYVNAHTDLHVSLWAADFGYPIGTMAWSARVESQAAFVGAIAPLLADDGYLDLLETAATLVSAPGEDSMRELVYGTPGEPPPLGAVARLTTATAEADRIGDAIGWAVEIAQYVAGVMESPVSVFTEMFGGMGRIVWIGSQANIVAAEAAAAKGAGDVGYLSRLAASKGLFIPGSGHVTQATRVA